MLIRSYSILKYSYKISIRFSLQNVSCHLALTFTWGLSVILCLSKSCTCLLLQWECKTDMDSRYRFGEIAVNCEGYSYPDDPYILKGSCGVCFWKLLLVIMSDWILVQGFVMFNRQIIYIKAMRYSMLFSKSSNYYKIVLIWLGEQ